MQEASDISVTMLISLITYATASLPLVSSIRQVEGIASLSYLYVKLCVHMFNDLVGSVCRSGCMLHSPIVFLTYYVSCCITMTISQRFVLL